MNPLLQTILNSKAGHLNQHLKEPVKKNKKIVKARNDCAEVQKMHWDLKYWCIEKGFDFKYEFQFDKKERKPRKKGEPRPPKDRQYRFDFAVITPVIKIGIEYHGLQSKKSGHTTLLGFTSDTEKANLATSLGWKVITYTVLTYQNVIQDLEKIIT